MNFFFKEVLEALTEKPYSSDVYQMAEPFVTESELILERRDKQKIVLNTSVRDLLRKEWPDVNIPDLLYGTECAALGFEGPDMETGAVCVDIYLTRGDTFQDIVSGRGKTILTIDATVHRRCVSYCKAKEVNVTGTDSTKKREELPSQNGIIDRNGAADDDLPPATPRVKRPASTPVCRIEAEALNNNIIEGEEDVDWHTEISEECGNRIFWPTNERKRLVLRQDLSVLHPDLKPGFEFDELAVPEHKEIELRIGQSRIETTYTLKVGAYELVAGGTPEEE